MADITIKDHLLILNKGTSQDLRSLNNSMQQRRDWEKTLIEYENTHRELTIKTKDIQFTDKIDRMSDRSTEPDKNTRQLISELGDDDFDKLKDKPQQSINLIGEDLTLQTGVQKIDSMITDSIAKVVSDPLPGIQISPSVTNRIDQKALFKGSTLLGSMSLDRNLSGHATKVGKIGFHVYESATGELKVWLRDKSISKNQGMKIIGELNRMFLKLGKSLALFSLNGELVKPETNRSNSLIQDEVGI